MAAPVLAPVPQKVESLPGSYLAPRGLVEALSHYSLAAGQPPGVRVVVERTAALQPEGYRLSVAPEGIAIQAGDPAGLFYAVMTLRQLLRQGEPAGRLPCVRIEDWPELPVRGAMLDISRDRVPTMETLKGLIELWAGLKYNQLQLYTEHTFAYLSHPAVWREASPLTAEEVRELDRYCADRAIELVPNQNSFGHMERWLRHPPYDRLAETPGGFTDPWGVFRKHPSTLNPLDPQAVELLAGLYDELLPNFRSRLLNVGGDEPWELGQGRSAEACRERGTGRVYLEFLLKIHEQVRRRGRAMQFYGDIIVKYPELIGELPKDSIALEWGYEADHPFEREVRAFAEAGLPFYVCSGTSAWNSLGGRWGNARGNILSAALQARKAGAAGCLLTEWGDNGHWQQHPIPLPAYVYAAAVGWCARTGRDLAVEPFLSRHLFADPTGRAARALMLLQNVWDDGIQRLHNAGILAVLLLDPTYPYYRRAFPRYAGYTFEHERALLEEAGTLLEGARMTAPETALLEEELRFTTELMLHATRLGRARFATPALELGAVDPAARRELAQELEALLERYRSLWLARSRPGGLADSSARFMALLECYRQG
jgi:hexosaminidase